MNTDQAKILKKMIREAVESLREDFISIYETIDDNAIPFELRTEAPTAIEVGKLVQVFAVRADAHGLSVHGDTGRVVEVDPGSCAPGSITVEMLKGPHHGIRFDVYPQQCVVLNGKS